MEWKKNKANFQCLIFSNHQVKEPLPCTLLHDSTTHHNKPHHTTHYHGTSHHITSHHTTAQNTTLHYATLLHIIPYLSERHISILHGFCLHGSPSNWTGREAVEVRVTLIPYGVRGEYHMRGDER